ncbi:unnamed protein product [Mytilus edulis]|uniref:Dynamin N-terminal domain-containing protein n=1 Tax=Mytilus edulis TaxID=6550 RepID=A0A8S3ULF3_MYTED|nr:unnamed protein product [Mytilus edulis]
MSERKRSLSGPACSTPSKRKKYSCSYSKCWESEFKWVKPSERSQIDAYCTLCNSHINVSAGARNDLVRHSKTMTHSKLEKSQAESKGMASFFTKTKSVLADKVTNAETLFSYFVAEHNLSFAVTDHFTKLCKLMFSDSEIASGYSCGKTKTTQIEWENELQLLKKDLTDKNGKIKKVKPDPETEAGVAFLKMRAVYGKFETFEQLSRPTPVTRCLGKIETVKSRCSSTFRNKIDKYIENTSSKTGGQYWPIIKSVTIRIPHCSVCSNGCTLVDLPGVRDSNAARDRIAKDYLKNCSVILVVAEVHRASTSKTAKELLGDNFRRQLLMDGQYGNVAFICTKNDVLQPSELIRELELDEQTDSIEENLNLMMIKMDELKQTERSLKEEIQWLLVDINTLTNGVDELQKDITEITELVSLVDTQEENEQLEELRSDLQRKSVKLSLKQQAGMQSD